MVCWAVGVTAGVSDSKIEVHLLNAEKALSMDSILKAANKVWDYNLSTAIRIYRITEKLKNNLYEKLRWISGQITILCNVLIWQ